MLHPFYRSAKGANPASPLFWIKDIPYQAFYPDESNNQHSGIDALLHLMGENGLKFCRSLQSSVLSGPSGMIASNDVVLIKVNAQWKYRGCTNSDLIRGLIQSILDHPDGFRGEVVIFENGQGRGSLNCDTGSNYPDAGVHANANDESQSFLYLVNNVFGDPRVSSYLLDPIRGTFIGDTEHVRDGYRRYENVSYPCFTTDGGHRIELREGLWNGNGYSQNLKLINGPVLKYHDTGGSEITASLKHFYGVVSMSDGYSDFRHYGGLGETCGRMMVSVRTPVLNIIDAIWVSHSSLSGYPANATFRANQILASQDPVVLDYWAAKYILYPISGNSRHLPTPGGIIDGWLTSARDIINQGGGLSDPASGILIDTVTKNEGEMAPHLFNFSDTPSITLQSPLDRAVFGSCFLINTHQPSFEWTSTETLNQYTILFSTSQTNFHSRGTLIFKSNIQGQQNSWIPTMMQWKRLLGLSHNNGNQRDIYWKVIGIRSDHSTIESDVWSFRIGSSQAVTLISPSIDAALPPNVLPTIEFNSNCNIKVRLEFGSVGNFSIPMKVRGFVFTIKDPNVEAVPKRTLNSWQWTTVKKLVGGGAGYLRIKAWDGINRVTISGVIPFTVQ